MNAYGAVYHVLKIITRSMSFVRGLTLFCTIKACGGKVRGIPRVGKAVTFKYPPHPGIRIGKNCDIGPGCYFDVPPGGILEIGDDVKFTSGVIVSAIQFVSIGDNSMIAEWCSVRDSQHNYEDSARCIKDQGLSLGKISIGMDVWIGRGASIFSNSSLGDGCIVGANCIVKGKVLQPGFVYVGNELTPLRERAPRRLP